eukprot:COSAG06_NODE_4346_length_4350_cov_12.286756_1_plen_80_part_00
MRRQTASIVSLGSTLMSQADRKKWFLAHAEKPLFQNQFKIQMQSIQNLFSTGFIFHGTSYDKLSFPQLFSLCVLQSVVF